MQLPQTVELKGIRVLTTKQIAECYGTTTAIIKKNFSNNRSRFKDGSHYISLTGDELKAFKNQVTENNLVQDNQVKKVHLVDGRASHLYLWTEKGALLHAKSLNTDKAWEVYDYLVDFYFRAKEKQESEKKEVVPVSVKTEPLKDELTFKIELQDEISVFKTLLTLAEARGMKVKTKDLRLYKSRLCGDRIAIRKGLTLGEVNYEIAFELFHAVVNCDKGNMIDTPLMIYYNSQAERAESLIIELLNTKIA